MNLWGRFLNAHRMISLIEMLFWTSCTVLVPCFDIDVQLVQLNDTISTVLFAKDLPYLIQLKRLVL